MPAIRRQIRRYRSARSYPEGKGQNRAKPDALLFGDVLRSLPEQDNRAEILCANSRGSGTDLFRVPPVPVGTPRPRACRGHACESRAPELTVTDPFRTLIGILDPARPVLVQTHDFPDHDAVGSAYGLSELLRREELYRLDRLRGSHPEPVAHGHDRAARYYARSARRLANFPGRADDCRGRIARGRRRQGSGRKPHRGYRPPPFPKKAGLSLFRPQDRNGLLFRNRLDILAGFGRNPGRDDGDGHARRHPARHRFPVAPCVQNRSRRALRPFLQG